MCCPPGPLHPFPVLFLFYCALRQWHRGNIVLTTTLPVQDCLCTGRNLATDKGRWRDRARAQERKTGRESEGARHQRPRPCTDMWSSPTSSAAKWCLAVEPYRLNGKNGVREPSTRRTRADTQSNSDVGGQPQWPNIDDSPTTEYEEVSRMNGKLVMEAQPIRRQQVRVMHMP